MICFLYSLESHVHKYTPTSKSTHNLKNQSEILALISKIKYKSNMIVPQTQGNKDDPFIFHKSWQI